MKIGFIGAGKVGTAVGLYFKEAGHEIVGYFSRSYDSATRSAEMTGSVAYEQSEPLIETCEVVLITTPDTLIGDVAKTIARQTPNCVFGHMSGALTSEVLSLNGLQGPVFSLHPLQAFATIEKGRQDLVTCTFAIEGNEAGVKVAKELLKPCSNPVVTLKKDQKALYHGAACVTSNYLMAITALAEEMIRTFDPEGAIGLSAYKNLMFGALENAIAMGSEHALTGPIARGDVATVKTHLDAMPEGQMKKDYSTLGLMTVALANREKLTDPVLKEQFRTLLEK